MRPHCALYVDVGYLLASAATRLTGTSLRSGVTVDHERLVADLAADAVERSGLPLLRVHWYDSAPQGVPNHEQRQIALLPRVKLRLGRIGIEGKQKGVDLRIGLDLVAHARNGAVDVAYLISGDDDLTEAVEEAQARGVQVVVVGVPSHHGGAAGVSRHLQRAADDLVLIAAETLDAAVRQTEQPGPDAPDATADGALPALPDGSSGPPPASAVPSPAMFANRQQTPPAPPRPVTPDYTGTEVERIIESVVDHVVSTWWRGATDEQRAAVAHDRPSVPRELDRTLLLDAAARLDVYDLDDQIRYQLRRQFWHVLDQQ